jgi:hypothetical protein
MRDSSEIMHVFKLVQIPANIIILLTFATACSYYYVIMSILQLPKLKIFQ